MKNGPAVAGERLDVIDARGDRVARIVTGIPLKAPRATVEFSLKEAPANAAVHAENTKGQRLSGVIARKRAEEEDKGV